MKNKFLNNKLITKFKITSKYTLNHYFVNQFIIYFF